METRLDASAIWLRALFAGSFAVFLGVAGHVMANGLLPGPAFLVALYAGMVAVGVPFLSRPASRSRMLLLLVGGQTFIHLCLTLTAGHAGDAKPRSHPALAGERGLGGLPVVDGRRVGSLQDAFVGTDQQPATTPTLPIHHLVADVSAHAPMMVAHLVVAALVALWLAHGERCVFSVLAITARFLLQLVRPVVPMPLRALPRLGPDAAEVAVRFRVLLLGRSLSRRGPPLLVA